MESDVQKSAYIHDAFISYSRKDKEFARRLDKALEDYKPPKNLRVPQRNLDVFRDEEDFTGVEYQHSVAKHLKDSAKLIVLCSPNSRKSKYVNDEIRLFAEANGADNIISILVSGIPNNEAKPGQEGEMAFPEALCEAMEMPLATSYLGFDLQKDKVNKGVFYGSWNTILANIYNISRNEIEQREKRRQARRRNLTIGVVSGIILALSVAFVITLISRQEAVRQRKEAERRRFFSLTQSLSSQALLQKVRGNRDERAALLALQAYIFNQRYKGHVLAQVDNALRTVMSAHYSTPVLNGDGLGVNSIAFSPNGNTLASGSDDKTIRSWDLSNPNSEPIVLGKHKLEVTSVAFSPDGKTLASGSWDRTIRLWNLANPVTKPNVLRGHEGYVYSVAFSPDGKTLASGSDDGTIHLWDLSNSSAEPIVLRDHESSVSSIAFSPDGKTLASGSWDGTIRLWDLSRLSTKSIVLQGNKYRIRSVAFSPDGRTLAGNDDRTVRLWDPANPGEEPKVLQGHEGEVTSVTFSPDGSTLASGSLDFSVRLWDLTNPTAEPIVLRGHKYGVSSAAFSPDGKTLASGSYDKAIIIWIAKTEILTDLVCEKVRNNLSLDDWNRFVGADLPYERTCPNRPLHPSFILAGEDLARSGDTDGAVVIFKRALELDPDLILDPKKEAKKFAAEGLVIKGRNLARDGNVDDAVALFQKALESDPGLKLDPKAEAKPLAVSGLIEKGSGLARHGDIEGAIISFQKAKELDPTLDLDPDAKAKKLAAPSLVVKGERLLEQGKVKEAIRAYTEAQRLDPELKISAESRNILCWNGSLWGYAEDVMNACEQAVALDPENAGSWDSRGVARALVGNTKGAIDDFQEFIDRIEYFEGLEEVKLQRQRWIETLRTGKNPFTPEEIEELRRQ